MNFHGDCGHQLVGVASGYTAVTLFHEAWHLVREPANSQ